MYDFAGNPFYNPAVNPYMAQPRQYQPQPKQEVVKVNGENGARAFPIGANSSALLLDETGVLVWLVTTDGAGYKTVAAYDITPHETAPAPNFSDLETRISRLEEMIKDGHTGNPATAQPVERASYVAYTGSAEVKPDPADGRRDQKRK